MLSFNPLFLPVVLLLMLGSLSLTTHAADPVPIYHFCANSTFSQTSLYNSSLNSLLSSLSSNVTRNIEFYNTTSGQNTSDPVYGLFLCRGDVPSQMCRTCVAAATKELAAKCSREKVAVIWYDECMIRYSNESIFSTVAVRPRLLLVNTQNTTDYERFTRLVSMTTTVLASGVLNVPIGVKKFGVKQTKFSEFQNLYSLVQCTPDLSSDDCNMCLWTAIRILSTYGEQLGGRVMLPSCNVRYELYPFYGESTAPPPVPGPASPPPPTGSAPGSKGTMRNTTTRSIVVIVVPTLVVIILAVISIIYLFLRGRKHKDHFETMDEMVNVESLQFSFDVIRAATCDFSDANKVGKGGFGPVYEGKLPNGQHIAVKRLSRNSGQGNLEFKNEVVLVVKLQHRNLVRLLGFCLEGNERLLVYEFVPNGSLDHYIFDPKQSANLDWESRYKIIKGIARGLLYLHEDSRLRIIHRDLKAANVLLDIEMNPNISDFGMARMCVLDQTEGSTNRIVGTYGYMAPEYAMLGQFSVKSDVFSFGVLMLEIVSGQKITSFREGENREYLLSYAWKNWKEGTTANLIDLTLRSGPLNEIIRCIHIGLLCVQANVADRLDMATVVLMLNSNFIALPLPTQPASFMQNGVPLATSMKLDTNCRPVSQYEVSITELDPR